MKSFMSRSSWMYHFERFYNVVGLMIYCTSEQVHYLDHLLGSLTDHHKRDALPDDQDWFKGSRTSCESRV
jgi:hypothetical protein